MLRSRVAPVVAPDVGEHDEQGARHVPAIGTARSLLTGIDAIVFEPAGVLYDSTLWWRWLLSLLTRLNPTCPVEHFERLWQREYLPAVQQGRRELAEAFEACLAASGYARCQIEELTAAAMVRRRELELEVHPLPGVAATLTRLRAAGFRLALTCDSTSPPDELASRLARYHLEGSFEFVLCSIELGHTKPGVLAYQAIQQRLNLAVERLLFVGCRANDLDGAAACGWPTVMVGPGNAPGPWPRPHAHLPRLADLLREVRPTRPTAAVGTSS
jgi:HAD superfamily hydrolase (TIGR01509 family)